MVKEFLKRTRSCRGFTLIELLTVIAIVAVLAGLSSANFVEVRKKARDSQRKTDIGQLQSSLEQYRANTGSYPISQSGVAQINNTPCAQPFQAGNTTYLKHIPCDPLGAASYFNNGDYYYYSADGSSYVVGACLERKSDPDGQAMPPS